MFSSPKTWTRHQVYPNQPVHLFSVDHKACHGDHLSPCFGGVVLTLAAPVASGPPSVHFDGGEERVMMIIVGTEIWDWKEYR